MKEIIKFSGLEKYHSGFEREKKINEIVIHGTGGMMSAKSLLDWMVNGGREAEYKKGIALFHFLIDYNGDIYQIIDPERWVYHSSSGKHDEETIGIEHMNQKSDNSGEYTIKQYQSSRDLIAHLVDKYPDIETVIGHGQNKLKFSHEYKKCPGNYHFDSMEKLLGDEWIYDHSIPEKIVRSFTP